MTMFAAQLLGPTLMKGPWAWGSDALTIPDVQVYAIAAVMVAATVCGFMALPRRAKQLVVGIVVASVIGVTLVAAAEPKEAIHLIVDGLECCDEWLFRMLAICLPPWLTGGVCLW